MSNVFERLIGAGEAGEGVALAACDVRELMALYHASFEEDAEARRPFHLNEYLTDRAFGGGEEGGWWYDTGRFVACHGAFGTVDEATAARDAKANWLADRRQGLHDPDSVLCTGWPVLRIEPHPGADFPATPPRYE